MSGFQNETTSSMLESFRKKTIKIDFTRRNEILDSKVYFLERREQSMFT